MYFINMELHILIGNQNRQSLFTLYTTQCECDYIRIFWQINKWLIGTSDNVIICSITFAKV